MLLGAAHDVGPAIGAHEDALVALLASLGDDLAVVLVVVRAEDGIRARSDDGGQLAVEVDVAVSIALLRRDRDALLAGFLDECVVDALLVVAAGVVDRADRLVALLSSEVCHELALIRVGDAGTEGIGAILDKASSRCRCRDERHVVVHGLLCNSDGRRRGDIADDCDIAVLDHLLVGVDSLGGIALLIHLVELDVLAIDLRVQREVELHTIADGQAVLCDGARIGAENTQLDRAGVRGAGARVAAGCQAESSGRSAGCLQERTT